MQYVDLESRMNQQRAAVKANAVVAGFIDDEPKHYEDLDRTISMSLLTPYTTVPCNPYSYDPASPAWMKTERTGHRMWGGSGYGDWKFEPHTIRERVGLLAMALPRLMRKLEADAIVMTGQSGIVMGAALQMVCELPLVFVRKEKEDSHGSRLEGTNGLIVRRYVILDDFVAGGGTVRSIQAALPDAECVGVVEHQYVTKGGDPVQRDAYQTDFPPIYDFKGTYQ